MKTKTKEEQDLLDELESMVYQACQRKDGKFSSYGISAYAEAIDVLAEYGRLKIVISQGKVVLAEKNNENG